MAAGEGFVWRFLHLFSGEQDKLAEALEKVADDRGFRVEVVSYDIARGQDLTDPEVVRGIKEQAKRGHFHAAHSGFPCTTFTRRLPGPVRSRDHVYGLPSNTREEQAEADRGTLMACQSLEILDAVKDSAEGEASGRPVTFENPPETDHPFAASAYLLPEVIAWIDRNQVEFADFNNCLYADDKAGEPRYKKPQRFVGTLRGLGRLSGTCRCDRGFRHPSVVGREASRASASYPAALCLAIANLVADAWLGGQRPVSPKAGTSPGPPKALLDEEIEEAIQEAEWTGGGGKFGALRESRSKKQIRDRENREALGGLRRPTFSLERVPGLRAVGREISDLFDKFVEANAEAETVGELYGTPGFEPRWIQEWRAALRGHFRLGAITPGTQPQGPLDYHTPVDTDLLAAWVERAGDPDIDVARWLKEGAPLGANLDITTRGVFPPKADNDDLKEEYAVTDLHGEIKNYKSFTDSAEDADLEMKRLVEKGLVKKITLEQAHQLFDKPVVSKLGLIVKEKPDGSKKRRVIVDALRSGANQQARCPERIVLPRPNDVQKMLTDMKASEPQLRTWYRAQDRDQSEWSAELVAADFTDAFTHFPVARQELQQCVSPAGDGKHMFVFVALFFGHKTAPLVMCRLSALLTRILQGIYWQAELQLGTYIDDPLFLLQGSRSRRNRNISLALLSLGALGLQIAWGKGARGTVLTWIGAQFSLKWAEGQLLLGIPDKLRGEILEKLDGWKTVGMVPLAELRTLAGKLTWAAGIYNRARWAVAIVFAAIAGHEADLRSGEEEARRTKREDKRSKAHLVPVKRFELARHWLAELFRGGTPVTRCPLWTSEPTLMLITDASPQGCGGLLLVRASSKSQWTPVHAYEYAIEQADALLLGFELGSHKAQSYLETLVIFIALGWWGKHLAAIPVGLAVRSDSLVALAILDKASSASPALNMLAAEIALKLEQLRVGKVCLSHVPGKLNVLADWLSRPQTRADRPGALADLKVKQPPKLCERSFSLGPRHSHDASVAGAAWGAMAQP